MLPNQRRIMETGLARPMTIWGIAIQHTLVLKAFKPMTWKSLNYKCGLGFGNMNYLPQNDAQGTLERDYETLDLNQSEA